MAHYARIRPSGFWTLASVIDPAEYEAFDGNLFKAFNGDEGGTWAPTAAIVLGGEGLEISSAPLVLTSADVHGSVSMTDNLTIDGIAPETTAITIGSSVPLQFADASDVVQLVITGGELLVNGLAAFDGGSATTFAAGSTVAISGTESIESGGELDVKSGANLNVKSGGTATIESGGDLAIKGDATVSNSGTIFVSSGCTLSVDALGTLTLDGSNRVKLSSRSITRTSELEPHSVYSTAWRAYTDLSWQCNASTSDVLNIPIHVPHGNTLTAVVVTILPTSGHSALPATMPTLKVYKVVDGVTTQIGSTTTDGSANTGAYEVKHTLTVSGLSEVSARATTRYFAMLTNEGSTNAAAGLLYYNTKVTYDAVQYDED